MDKNDFETIVVPMYVPPIHRTGIDGMEVVPDQKDQLNTRPAPRMPRQTEPAPLWWVLAVVTAALGIAAVLMGFDAHAVVAVVSWLREVLP